MDRATFLEKLKNVLQRDNELKIDMEIKDIEEWDSLAVIATIAFLDKEFGVKTVFNDFKEIKTIQDIAKKAGI